jgi:hypothetical protein
MAGYDLRMRSRQACIRDRRETMQALKRTGLGLQTCRYMICTAVAGLTDRPIET